MAENANKSKMLVVGALVIAVLAGGGYLLLGKNGGNAVADDMMKDLAAVEGIDGGNPVVATVNGHDITRADVFRFIERMPEQSRRMPIQNLYPMAFEQVINAKIVEKKMDKGALERDAKFVERMEQAKDQIMRGVFIENEVSKRVKESEIKEAYEAFAQGFEAPEEVRARHILVKDEAKAKEIIAAIKDGGSFEALAAENSMDGTAQEGGDLGYFTRSDVVKPFGDVAFTIDLGKVHDTPVKSEFGYHVVKVEDKRTRPTPTLEQIRGQIEAQLRRSEAGEMLEEWREQAEITRFDINGQPLPDAPAAGDGAAATEKTDG